MIGGGADLGRHRDGARLSLLPAARPLLRHRHHRDRRDRAAVVPELELGRRRARHRHSRARRQLAAYSSSPRSKLPYFYFALALACVAWLVTWWLENSKWGFWWRAVKDNPDAAESLGVVVFNSKMGAAAVSAFLTAVGGGFYAQFVSYIDPESVMGFQFSLLMALPAVVGGIGTLWGPVLGADHPDTAYRVDALVHRRLRPRHRSDRLRHTDRADFAGAPRGPDRIVRAAAEGAGAMTALLGNQRRLAALRRADRQQRRLDFGRARRDRRPDRPERRRQIDAVQPDRGRAAADARFDPVRWRGRHRAAGGRALPARHRAHVPGREKFRDHDRDRQCHRRRADPHHRDARGPPQGARGAGIRRPRRARQCAGERFGAVGKAQARGRPRARDRTETAAAR